MARFTVSQLNKPYPGYSLVNTDLLLATAGTASSELSSVQISLKQLSDYSTSTYATKYGYTIAGPVSAQGGLSARGVVAVPDVPSGPSTLQSGEVFYQTAAQVVAANDASIRVLCVKV